MTTSLKVPVTKRPGLPPLLSLNATPALAVLAVCFLMNGPPKATAQAPSSIVGKTFSGRVTAATTPPWAPPGSRYLWLADSSGNGFQVRGIWQVSNGGGTYSWSASGATGTANCADGVLGPLVATFTFSTESSGTLDASNPPYFMDSDFEMFSGVAPSSVASNTYHLQIEDGGGGYPTTGSALLKINTAATAYEIVGDEVNTHYSSGTCSYSRLNTSTGTLLLADSVMGNTTMYFSFSNSVAGGFAAKTSLGSYVVGHFIQLPTLSIAFEGGNIVLSWPTNFVEFRLQEKVQLESGTWFDLAAMPVVINGNYTVTIPMTASDPLRMSYRLRNQ